MSSDPVVAACPASFGSSGGLSIVSVRFAGGLLSPGGWLSPDVLGSGPSGTGAVWGSEGPMSGMAGASVGVESGGSGPGVAIPGGALSGFSLESSDAPVVVSGVIGATS